MGNRTRRWHVIIREGKYYCFGPRCGTGAGGATAEIAFVKWLLYWGNNLERLEFAATMQKYQGDLWDISLHS
jgi:hypothetical protein